MAYKFVLVSTTGSRENWWCNKHDKCFIV